MVVVGERENASRGSNYRAHEIKCYGCDRKSQTDRVVSQSKQVKTRSNCVCVCALVSQWAMILFAMEELCVVMSPLEAKEINSAPKHE